jgi:hypothetical protein
MAETQSSQHLGLILTAIGILIAIIIGALQIPQTRNLVCEYSGTFCSRESQIDIFTVDYMTPGGTPGTRGSAWDRFLSYAGATAADSACFAGGYDQIVAKGFTKPSTSPETYKHGNEAWVFTRSQNLARQRDRSLIFDLQAKYPKSMLDENITVTVKPYFQDYRIYQLDKSYHITLPSGTDYETVSCDLNIPDANVGSYTYDFEISDYVGGADPVVRKTVNVTQ